MKTFNKPLFALTANDLMTQTLVIVPQEMSLQGAAHLLMQSQVTGAPVVDETGKCIGVLSSMDFVHLVDKNAHGKRPCDCRGSGIFSSSQIVEFEEEEPQLVRDFMTANPVTISPSTNIGELAQMMLDAHIHRVIVCSGEGRPIGLVSSTDILAAVARAYQTQEAEPLTVNPGSEKGMVDKLIYSLG
jgi:CBS domain-containing protein